MNKKTVLIVTSHYPPNIGGVESHLQALVNGLNRRNWQVVVSTYQPLAYSKQAPSIEKHSGLIIYRQDWLGFNIVHRLTPYPALEFLYLFPGLFIGTLKVMFKNYQQIDVVHCQGLVPTAVGALIAKLFNKKVIASTHNLYFFPKKSLYSKVARLIFNLADQILVPTDIAKNELTSIGVKKDKIGFFKYWIDLKKFKPNHLAKTLPGNFFKVLFVGRLIPTKGLNIILELLESLKEGIKVFVAGSGAMEEQIKQAATKYPSRFAFLGRIENDRISNYYSNADLIIAPSTVDEGWGFVAMEAVASGTPIIASNKGGLSDAVNPKIGLLVPATTTGFKKAIEDLSRGSTKLQNLKRNCRQYALDNFSETNVEGIIKFYDKQY